MSVIYRTTAFVILRPSKWQSVC